MKRLILMLLMLPIAAIADPQPWMKKDNPNELTVFGFAATTCPFSIGEIEEEAMNVLVRSRIKPHAYPGIGRPYIYVNLQCATGSTEQLATVSFSVEYVDAMKIPDGRMQDIRYSIESNYAFIGRGSKDLIRSSIREEIEDFVTDYLKANFDLGEEE